MQSRILKIASLAALVVLAGVCVAQTPAPASEEIKLDTGLVYARGSYGLPSDTDITIALVNPTYETEDWRLQASFPYIWLKGPASVVGNAGTAAASRTEHGVGDATFAVTRKFGVVADGWSASFGGKIKFPTADENKGLGTGQTDVSFETDVFRKIGRITPYGTLGYQFLGRSDLYPMKDGLFGSLGLVTLVPQSPGLTVGVGGNWRQPTISGGSQAVEAMAFLQQKFSARSHLQVFLLHGFTDASPTLAVGATLGLKF